MRVNKLFERLSDEQNFFYLSGLLIGSELRSLMVYPDMQVLLCSSSNVYLLYHEAISELGLSQQTSFISPEIMNRAVVHGHVKLLNDNVCFLIIIE